MTDQQNTQETPITAEELQTLLVDAFNKSMREIASEIQAVTRKRVNEGSNPGAAAAAAALVAADLLGVLAVEQEGREGASPAEEHSKLLLTNMVNDMEARLTESINFYRVAREEFKKTQAALTPAVAANDETIKGDSDAA